MISISPEGRTYFYLVPYPPFPRRGGVYLYWSAGEPIYRLLLRVGIKVADEWQKSLGYVRGSNIYVRGYLD